MHRAAAILFLLTALAATCFAQTPSKDDLEKQVQIQFPNSDVNDIAKFYGSLTGRKVTIQPGLSGKITIVTPHPIPKRQAISLVRDSLMQNGIEVRDVGATETYITRLADPVTPTPDMSTPTPSISPIKWPPPAP